jgi:phosphatidate cytidylyltransferase
MLKQRVITAIILVLLAGISLFVLPVEGFVAFVSIVVLLAAWEWSDLASLKNKAVRLLFCAVIAALFTAAYSFCGFDTKTLQIESLRQIFIAGAAWWVIALALVKTYPASTAVWQHPFIKTVMGLFVLFPAWAAFIYLRYLPNGELWVVALVAIVAAADIGAYFSGRRFGRRKLAVQVSPGKSWEGFWGGLLAVVIVAALASNIIAQLSLLQLITIAVLTALASVLGDLLESMVKRQRGIKDSGWMLPGHGGFMDRIDSLTAAAPVFALSLLIVMPTAVSGVAR